MKKIKLAIWPLIVLAVCIIVGFVVFYFVIKAVDKDFADELVWTSDLSIAAINTDRIKKLSDILPADISMSEDYIRIKSQIVGLGDQFEVNGVDAIYVLSQDEGQIRFIAESTPEGEPLYVSPGIIYEQAPSEVFEAFNGISSSVVSYSDEYGTYISKFTPIFDTKTSEQVGVLGVDVDYGYYQKQIIKTKILFSTAWSFLCFIVILLFLYFRNLSKINSVSQINEKRISAITNSISDGLVVTDNNNQIVFWNKASEKIFGLPKENALNLKFNELVKLSEVINVQTNKVIPDFVLAPDTEFLDNVLEIKLDSDNNDEPRYYELSLNIMNINNIKYLIGVFHNISIRKKEQNDLKMQKDELEKLNNLMVGRELKMMEIKKELSELKEKNK
jgi:PAS domain S-box-containing protein